MRLLEPIADPAAPAAVLARRNPVAKLSAVFGLTAVLLVAADPVTPSIALLVELASVPLFGIRYGALLRRGAPLLVGAAAVFVVTLLFTTREDAVAAALGLSLRLVALALPGVLAFASTDPTDLADALVQHVRVPPRFAIGALAALRLAPLLQADWEALTLARRARGIDAGANPVARVRLFAGTTFALLVAAIRRGGRLATAMDARGFDAGLTRTVARPQRFRAADAGLVAGGVLVGVVAVGVSVAVGAFRPLF